MKKPRTKKYRPRPVSANAMDWAIAGAHKMPAADIALVMAPVLAGYDLLRKGGADRPDWNDVCTALNMGEALTELHIGDNLRPDFDAGHAALHQIALRMLAGKGSTCYSGELLAVKEAIDMYQIQLGICTQAEFSRALKRVKNLLLGGATDDVAQTYARLNEANP